MIETGIFRKQKLGPEGPPTNVITNVIDPDQSGRVVVSSTANSAIASPREVPHIPGSGRSEAQNAGRSGVPNSRQRRSSSNCTQGIPAGLPYGMPGMGEVIEGAVQQAPQFGRHCIGGGGGVAAMANRVSKCWEMCGSSR